ncbi:hypothetical protein ABIE67_000733 [Streptomyces sp. V4I8]
MTAAHRLRTDLIGRGSPPKAARTKAGCPAGTDARRTER